MGDMTPFSVWMSVFIHQRTGDYVCGWVSKRTYKEFSAYTMQVKTNVFGGKFETHAFEQSSD